MKYHDELIEKMFKMLQEQEDEIDRLKSVESFLLEKVASLNQWIKKHAKSKESDAIK